MNPKSYKFYKGIFELAKKDYINDPAAVKKFIENTLDFDFDVAVELWDYLITDAVAEKSPRIAVAGTLGANVLQFFLKHSAVKTYQCILSYEALTNVLYTMPDLPGAAARDILVSFLMGAKLDNAGIILKAMQKGPNYGAAMKDMLETLFAESKKKTGAAKASFPKKTSQFLLTHISKVKATERPLLEQRVKEIL